MTKQEQAAGRQVTAYYFVEVPRFKDTPFVRATDYDVLEQEAARLREVNRELVEALESVLQCMITGVVSGQAFSANAKAALALQRAKGEQEDERQ